MKQRVCTLLRIRGRMTVGKRKSRKNGFPGAFPKKGGKSLEMLKMVIGYAVGIGFGWLVYVLQNQ